MVVNIRKYFQITVMTYGPVILDVVTKQCDFCSIHLDNAAPSRRLKGALQYGRFLCVCIRQGEIKQNVLGLRDAKLIQFFFLKYKFFTLMTETGF